VSEDNSKKWNNHYANVAEAGTATSILIEFAHILPQEGLALDLACGLGANAVFLAQQGLKVQAWDTSRTAVTKLQALAACQKLDIDARIRDCERFPPDAGSLDVLVISNFLYRPGIPALLASLKPGGLLFYTTHTMERPDFIKGPNNPDYLLQPGELLSLCAGLRLHYYREDGMSGNLEQGVRGRASIIASREPLDPDQG